MNTGEKLHSLTLVSAAFILFLILVSSAASAATEQSASSTAQYAYITNYDSNTVSAIDTATNIVTATVPVGVSPKGIAVKPDGKKVYVANKGSDTVSVIDTATNKVTATINGFYEPIGVAFSPEGKKAYVISSGYTVENNTGWYSFGGNVSIIDTATNKVTGKVDIGSDPYGMAITPDGKKLYITYSFAYYNYYGFNAYQYSNGSVFDTTAKNIAGFQLRGMPFGVAVSPDGKKVYVASQVQDIERVGFTTQTKYYPIVSTVDTVTNKVIDTVKVGDNPKGVAVSPNGKKVYVTDWKDKIVSVIDTTTDTVINTVPVGVSPEGIAVNPDGKQVYVANGGSDTVSVIDTATNKVSATVSVGSEPWGVAVSPALKQVPPVANFTSNATSGKAPLTVIFTDKSIGSPTSWKWSFGDGTNSTIKNPTHKYSKAGNYTVALTATNAAGSNTLTKTNYIKVKAVAQKPVAGFSASPTSGKAPLKVQFTDTSTGSPTSWKWNFGDETTSTTKNPSHTYSKAGNYTVSLTVKNDAGSNAKTITNYITVKTSPVKPVAAFSATPTSGNSPLKVQFTDKSSNVPTSWKWSFGDGTHSTSKSPAHTYSKAGKYTVKLTVKNAAGSSTKTITNYITVKTAPVKPVATFSAFPTSGKAPLTVKFTDKSTGSPTSWSWNFGDKSTSTSKNPTHKYTKAGKYTVKLTVKNAAGSSTKTMSNYITVKSK